MLKYGAPTMVEMENLEQAVQVCAGLKLDFLELNINFPQYLLHALDVEKLKALSEKHGIFYTLHLDDEMSIADFNPYIADGYCRTVYDAIELSKKLGIKKLNMHLSRGAKYTLPDRVVYFFEAYRVPPFALTPPITQHIMAGNSLPLPTVALAATLPMHWSTPHTAPIKLANTRQRDFTLLTLIPATRAA